MSYTDILFEAAGANRFLESVLEDEKFWVDTTTSQVELVHFHAQGREEYGSIPEAIADGHVMGEYSNEDQTYTLVADSPRTLCLALRSVLTNFSATRGLHYQLLSGESGFLDYDAMMGFRLSGRLPPPQNA